MNLASESVCDERVFEQMFREHAAHVRNFIYSKCGNPDQADDLVQDAFVKLWNNCAKVPVFKVKSFLFKVVKNAFFNELDRQKVALKYSKSKGETVNLEDPSFLLREKEFQSELDRAINKLSEKDREVFLLNRIEKLKYKEIAELLEISVKTVEKRMHSALLLLRSEIKQYKF